MYFTLNYNQPMESKQKAYNTIKELVKRFGEHVDEYKRGSYSITLPAQRDQIQRAINHAERKIDELVYELYGLSEEEVKIVEGAEL